jgi:transposase
VDADGTTGPRAGEGEDAVARPAIARLDEIPGVSRHTARVILAEVGLDISRFPAAGHLASWAKLLPRTIQSGPKSKPGTTGQGNPLPEGGSRRDGLTHFRAGATGAS